MVDSRISTTEAAEMIGKSSRYIQKLIAAGTLSATRVNSRKYLIDKSEFIRVFPSLNTSRTSTKISGNVREDGASQESRYVKMLIAEKDRTIELLKSQLEHQMKINDDARLLLTPPKRKKIFGIF